MAARTDTSSQREIAAPVRQLARGFRIFSVHTDHQTNADQAGVDFDIACHVLVPNCCDLATDRVVGDVRIAQARGRAFETVIGIAVANYPAPRCDGHSFAVDASGRIIAMADAGAGLVLATFDLAAIRKARREERFRWRI